MIKMYYLQIVIIKHIYPTLFLLRISNVLYVYMSINIIDITLYIYISNNLHVYIFRSCLILYLIKLTKLKITWFLFRHFII